MFLFYCLTNRHTFRDMHHSRTVCPAFWAMKTNEVKKCTVRKKNILFWAGLSSQVRTKSPLPARWAQRKSQGRTPFICTPWVPTCLHFNSQQWPSLSSLYGCPTVEMALLTPAWRFRPGSRCSLSLQHKERQQADQQKVHSHHVLSSCSL
jgi:hypothetical protein